MHLFKKRNKYDLFLQVKPTARSKLNLKWRMHAKLAIFLRMWYLNYIIRTNRSGTNTRREVVHTPATLECHQEPETNPSSLHIFSQGDHISIC